MRASVQACAVGLTLTVLMGAPTAQAPQPPPGLRGMLQRAERDGAVRVIVGVETAFTPEGRLDQAAAARQRAAIAGAQQAALDRLAGLPIDGVRRFGSIPFFAARVGRAALERLAAMSEITSIAEDVAEAPVLAESAPLIGANTAWATGYTGSGWTVAVIDTGVDLAHPFFAGRIVSQACYSNAGNSGGGTSLCPGGASSSTAAGAGDDCPAIYDACFHGTHVAGIAAGRQYAGAPAFNGIAHGASLVTVQAFTGFAATYPLCGGSPCVLSFVSDQIAALQRVFELRNTFTIAAVNMSLGGGRYFDQASCDADNAARKAIIDQLRSVGIPTVAASGNEGFANALSAPACISTAVSVGSVNDGSSGTVADTVSSFSNSASFLRLLAPGNVISSAVPGGFAAASGTSMATPHVTGAWALLKQRKPLAGVSELLQALVRTGRPVSDPRSGAVHSRIDVAAAINDLRVDYMALDAPVRNTTVTQPFTVSGWALNMSVRPNSGTGVDTVHVWAFPPTGAPLPLGAAQYGLLRDDVAAVYGAQFRNSGWSIGARGLPPGVYTIAAYARNTTTGQFSQYALAEGVTVQTGARLRIEAPVNEADVTQPFNVSGWAIDGTASSGTGIDTVHVWAYRNPGSGEPAVFLGVPTYGQPRLDVASRFGVQFTNSGFSLMVSTLPAGRYLIAAYGHSTVSQSFSVVETVVIDVAGTNAGIDAPPAGSTQSQPFTISGWAIDRSASSGTGIDSVHVWVYPDPGSGAVPIFLGLASYGVARPDIASQFGERYRNSGFSLTVSGLPPGHRYLFAIFPHSAESGEFTLRTLELIVP